MEREVNISKINECIVDGKFKIKVKPNASKTQITSIENHLIKIDVKAKPIDNEANIEVVKYFSKLLKKKARIKSGLTSREKIIAIS